MLVLAGRLKACQPGAERLSRTVIESVCLCVPLRVVSALLESTLLLLLRSCCFLLDNRVTVQRAGQSLCWDCFFQVSLSNSEGTREGRTELTGIISEGPTVWSLQIPPGRALLLLHSPGTTCSQTRGTQTWIWTRIGALSD